MKSVPWDLQDKINEQITALDLEDDELTTIEGRPLRQIPQDVYDNNAHGRRIGGRSYEASRFILKGKGIKNPTDEQIWEQSNKTWARGIKYLREKSRSREKEY